MSFPVRAPRDDRFPSEENSVRNFCYGAPPLPAVLQPWMTECIRSGQLFKWVDGRGSPLNVLNRQPFGDHVRDLESTLRGMDLDFQIHFAHKANKSANFVDESLRLGIGIDVASEAELAGAIERGFNGDRVICTAAIKSESLIRRCIQFDVIIVVDNADELSAIVRLSAYLGKRAQVAIRLGTFTANDETIVSRFGFDADNDRHVIDQFAPLDVVGVHLHLDGASLSRRAIAIERATEWICDLRCVGHATRFLDIGGGIPVSHLCDGSDWRNFWSELDGALLGNRPPLTWQNDGLGRIAIDGDVRGQSRCFETHQDCCGTDWITRLMNQSCGTFTIQQFLQRNDIQLRCEPGRYLLDGCGITVARVNYCKTIRGGQILVGVEMNHTQCRTTYDDFLVDPILIPSPKSSPAKRPASATGYFVGAACTETELLSRRQFRFPQGIAGGDLVVFPNTAAYWMHMLESRTHQMNLADNVFINE